MEKLHMPEIKRPTVPFLAVTWHKLTLGPSGDINKVLAPREYGQLKMLRNILEDVTVFVMVWVTSNWRVFTLRTVNSKGLLSAPNTPHIGFLLAHHAVAVNMMQETVPWQVAPLIARFNKEMEELRKTWAEEDAQPSH
jgi:hypothetical protein